MQRDLSDSTVARTFGTAFAHSLIGYSSLLRGFSKISVNEPALREALTTHPEVLAEAIQTVLRVAEVEMPYEKLKALTVRDPLKLRGLQFRDLFLWLSQSISPGLCSSPYVPLLRLGAGGTSWV